MKKRNLRALIAVALVPGLLGFGAVAAQAGTPNCASTFACWWTDTNYDGTSYGSAKNQGTWPAGIANKDSSAQNNGTSGNAVYTYNYILQVELMYCVRKGSVVKSIPAAKADRGQSHDWKPATSGCL